MTETLQLHELLRAYRDGHGSACKKLKVAITYLPHDCVKTYLGWYRVASVTEAMLCCESLEFDSTLWIPNPLTAPHKFHVLADNSTDVTLCDTVSAADTFHLNFKIYG